MSIQYASRRKRSNDGKLKALCRKLEQISNHLHNQPTTLIESEQEQMANISKDIEDIIQNRTRGAILHSRANWELNAGKNSKYFLSLEKRNFNKKTIHHLQLDNGEIVTNTKQIQNAQTEYYRQLYYTVSPMDLRYIDNLEMPIISTEEMEMLKQPPTLKEVSEAVANLPNNKVGGTDGIPIDFYKMFWPKLKKFIHNLILEIIEVKKMHLSARRGIISLLEKIEKNPLFLKNWRPLSLLNSDYKIFAKILATRLQIVLPKCIDKSQTGLIKSRYIGENIMKLLSLMEYCERNQKSSIVLSIDFEKAFNKLEWAATTAVFKKLGFPQEFCDMADILHTETYSCTMNNGYWSDWIPLSRGSRQGCPFSALAFCTTVESLGVNLHTNIRIKGIDMGNYSLLSYQYADDMWLGLDPSEDNLNEVISELEHFSAFAGLVVNYEKTAAFKLGPLRDSDARYYTMKKLFWSDGKDTVKILGIHIHPEWETMHQTNYMSLLDKAKGILSSWQYRNINLIDKIAIINALIASQFSHRFMCLPNPEFFKQYKQIITEFLWGHKPPKIRYLKLIQNYDKMGLKLIDLKEKDYALKASWITRWKKQGGIPDWIYVNLPVKSELIWSCNLSQKDIEMHFCRGIDMGAQLLRAWGRITYQTHPDFEDFITTPLWANSDIRRANTPFLQWQLITSNIITIEDIFNTSEKRYYTFEELNQMHGKMTDFLTYSALINAIPPIYKMHMRKINENINHDNIERISKLDRYCELKDPSKNMYWHLIERQKTEDACRFLWDKELGTHTDETSWSNKYSQILHITVSTKLHLLHYNILNRVLTTNIRRNKYNNNISPKCTFCHVDDESIAHLIFKCKKVRKMWEVLQKWCERCYDIKVEFNLYYVLFNGKGHKDNRFVQLLTLIMKQYVYSTKCKNENLEFISFIRQVNMWYNIEKTIAYKTQRIKQFQNKWKSYEMYH